MMSTHTAIRAGANTATGSAGPAQAPDPAARGSDFLATLAAALSIEVSATTRQEGLPAEVTADDTAQADAIDALIASLAPIVPAPQASQAGPDGGILETAPAISSALPGTARTGTAAPIQPADLLTGVTDAAADGAAAENPGKHSAARELPGQLLQTLAGPAREIAPEFRLAGSTDAFAGTTAQALASAGLHTPGSAATNAGEQVLRAAVGSPRWAEELGSRMVLMTTRGHQEGSLTLSPEHLGPLEVRISVSQNTAQVWFGAQHADTRAALAEALPRLREMFAEAGLSLGHAGVSQEAPRRQVPDVSEAGTGLADADATPAPQAMEARAISSALLDLYA